MNTISLIEEIRHTLMGFSMISLLKTVLIAVVGYLICRLVIKGLKKVLTSKNVAQQVSDTIIKISKICLGTVLIIIIFAELGINTSSLLILLAVCLLVLFFAAQDILSNIAGGLVVTSAGSLKKGDYVKINSFEGIVYEIHVNCTKIRGFDGETVTIPNKEIANSIVTNYSVTNARRAHITVDASYNSDMDRVMNLCKEVISSTKGVLNEYEIKIFISRYHNNNLEYSIYFWVKPANCNYMSQEVKGNIYRAFKKEGIEISHLGSIFENLGISGAVNE